MQNGEPARLREKNREPVVIPALVHDNDLDVAMRSRGERLQENRNLVTAVP
jgi:hypothetical protein